MDSFTCYYDHLTPFFQLLKTHMQTGGFCALAIDMETLHMLLSNVCTHTCLKHCPHLEPQTTTDPQTILVSHKLEPMSTLGSWTSFSFAVGNVAAFFSLQTTGAPTDSLNRQSLLSYPGFSGGCSSILALKITELVERFYPVLASRQWRKKTSADSKEPNAPRR